MSSRTSRCQNQPPAPSAIEPVGDVFDLRCDDPASCTVQYRQRHHINAYITPLHNVATPLSDFISSTRTRAVVQIPIGS